jgi:Fe2+ transport system protein B
VIHKLQPIFEDSPFREGERASQHHPKTVVAVVVGVVGVVVVVVVVVVVLVVFIALLEDLLSKSEYVKDDCSHDVDANGDDPNQEV